MPDRRLKIIVRLAQVVQPCRHPHNRSEGRYILVIEAKAALRSGGDHVN
jgi:hypothetical protein